MKDSNCYYAFQVREGDEITSIGPSEENRIEAGKALKEVLEEALNAGFSPGAVLECYYAPVEGEYPQHIWARIPLN